MTEQEEYEQDLLKAIKLLVEDGFTVSCNYVSISFAGYDEGKKNKVYHVCKGIHKDTSIDLFFTDVHRAIREFWGKG